MGHMRIPFSDQYVQAVGTAVYAFAYYEWTIIYTIERLEPGFVGEYPRGKPLTSGGVAKRFREALDGWTGNGSASRTELENCYRRFKGLIPKRNALIHAHPITDIGGAQILNYQASVKKVISDMKWDEGSVMAFAEEVDAASVEAGRIFEKLK